MFQAQAKINVRQQREEHHLLRKRIATSAFATFVRCFILIVLSYIGRELVLRESFSEIAEEKSCACHRNLSQIAHCSKLTDPPEYKN